MDKVRNEKRAIMYPKIEDQRGKTAPDEVNHRLSEGWRPTEAKLILDGAEPGELAVCFVVGS